MKKYRDIQNSAGRNYCCKSCGWYLNNKFVLIELFCDTRHIDDVFSNLTKPVLTLLGGCSQ